MDGGGILYDLVLVSHVLSAVVAVGAVLATGVFASVARRPGGPSAQGAVRRYFGPGTNWLPRVLYLVPLLGVALVFLGHRAARFEQIWLWLSTVLWVMAAALAQGVLWPAERRLQVLLTPGAGAAGRGAGGGPVGRVGRRLSLAAAGIDLCLLVAFVLMVGRPGSG